MSMEDINYAVEDQINYSETQDDNNLVQVKEPYFVISRNRVIVAVATIIITIVVIIVVIILLTTSSGKCIYKKKYRTK